MHFPFYVHVDLGFQLRRALGEVHFLSFHAAYIAVCWPAEPFSPLCPTPHRSFVYFNRWSQKSFSSLDVWCPCKALGFWAWTRSFTPSITWISCYSAWWSSFEENWIQPMPLWKPVCLSKGTVHFCTWPNCAKCSLSSVKVTVQGIFLINTTSRPLFIHRAIVSVPHCQSCHV